MSQPQSDDPVTEDVQTASIAYDALADRERRAVVAHFMTEDSNTASVNDLITQYQEMTGDEDISANSLEIRLHHQHLPKLADAGIIEYDARSQTVRYHGGSQVENLLESVFDSPVPEQ